MSFTLFITIMLTAITLENVVFARALGLTGYTVDMQSPRVILQYGGTYTLVTLLSSLGVTGLRWLGERYEIPTAFNAVIILLLIVLVYTLTYLIGRRIFRKNIDLFRRILPLTTFNTALFGLLFILVEKSDTLGYNIAYALGSGAGYTLALLLLLSVRERLALTPIPRSFRGVPILLIFIGLLSLAIYGLLGYSLAS